jgi:hypothetical protein
MFGFTEQNGLLRVRVSKNAILLTTGSIHGRISGLFALLVGDFCCIDSLHPLDRLSGLGDGATRVVVVVAIATTVESRN